MSETTPEDDIKKEDIPKEDIPKEDISELETENEVELETENEVELETENEVEPETENEVEPETVIEDGIEEILEEEKVEIKRPSFMRYFATIIIASIALALVAFAGRTLFFGSDKKANLPVAYVKDDALYIDNLKDSPYLAAEKLSDGGSYSSYYTAWGVLTSADGKTIYYSDNVSEDGRFDLYKRKAAPDKSKPGGEGLLISSDVMYYQISEDGSTAAYLRATEDGNIGLYTFTDSTKEKSITTNAILSENSFQLSEDGQYIVYEQTKTEGVTELASQKSVGGEEKLLTDSLALYSLAKETDKIYYVEQKNDSFAIYEYSFGQEPVLVSENVVDMKILGNEKDVLYCTQSSIQIKSSDIIEDDMAEADAAIKAPDIGLSSAEENKAYDEKAARDEIRLSVADGTFESPMQDCFIWSDGKSTAVDTEILNAKAAISKDGYVLYSKIDVSALEKVKLSTVTSLDEAKYMYFMNLSSAPRNTYMAKAGTEKTVLDRDDISADSFAVSPNGKRIGFNTIDVTTGNSKFYTATLDVKGDIGEATELADNVLISEFTGEGETLYWLEALPDSPQEGSLWVYENGEKVNVSEKVSGYRVAEDDQTAYFISDVNMQTGNGKLSFYKNGSTTDIDSDVFVLQYKSNGNLVYIKNYDIVSGKGELYYWNGKTSRLIDQGVSSIFIY